MPFAKHGPESAFYLPVKSFSMPAEGRLGLDHHQGLAPVQPKANRGYPQSRSHTGSRTRLRLLRWRTASWCQNSRISNWGEARVRRVEVKPARSDISYGTHGS